MEGSQTVQSSCRKRGRGVVVTSMGILVRRQGAAGLALRNGTLRGIDREGGDHNKDLKGPGRVVMGLKAPYPPDHGDVSDASRDRNPMNNLCSMGDARPGHVNDDGYCLEINLRSSYETSQGTTSRATSCNSVSAQVEKTHNFIINFTRLVP